VRLRSKVEDRIDIVSLKAVHDFRGVCNVAVVEREIPFVVEDSSVIQGRTVVELVEGYDIVRIGIGQGQMPY